MRTTPTGSLFAYRKRYTAVLFGNGRETVETGVVEADNLSSALQHVISRSSVLSLEEGVALEIVALDFSGASQYVAKYDGHAITDSNQATDAKLTVMAL
jgi:hypothetical protein